LRSVDAKQLNAEIQTLRRYDRLVRLAMRQDELQKHSFRMFCYYLFPGDKLRQHRRQALLTGKITMGDGRVIRRSGHVDLAGKDAA